MTQRKTLVGAVIAAALTAAPATAQQVCMRNGRPDPQTTAQLQRLLARPDPRVMQALVGTWYAETPNRATGQILYGYQTFEPNGLWQYHNRVCAGGMCSNYEGTGQFAGVVLGDGSISLIIMYSDLRVANACVGSVVRLVANGVLRDSNGGLSRRVR